MAEGEVKKTSLGLDQNLAGALAYFLGFISGVFLWVTEKENKFVRFHAMQSILVSVAFIVVSFGVGFIPFIGLFLSPLLGLAFFAGWLFLMYKAFKGEEFMVPYLGGIAKKQVG